MDKDSFYVKIYNEQIKNCGTVDCGCVIEKVESPHVTMKLCKTHEKEVRNHNKSMFEHVHVSPMIDNPKKFEAIHLAAVGSTEFD